MRSFQPSSLVSTVFLLLCSFGRARRHERPYARHQHKRYANAAFTYFDVGQGACGVDNSPSDFIVALNAAQYDGGSHCFDMITITVGEKTAQAQITDECMGCPYGGLDFSQGLFEYFAPVSEGEIYGSWTYNSDTTTTTTSTTEQPTSTSPAPTSTLAPTTTSSSAVSSTTSATSTLSSLPSTTAAAPTPALQNLQTIADIQLALIEVGALFQVSIQLRA